MRKRHIQNYKPLTKLTNHHCQQNILYKAKQRAKPKENGQLFQKLLKNTFFGKTRDDSRKRISSDIKNKTDILEKTIKINI